MEIRKPAIAGTLESSDCQVTIEPGNGKIDFELESAVVNQYGNQIRKVVFETLDNLEIKDAKITIIDKGALDCTISKLWSAIYDLIFLVTLINDGVSSAIPSVAFNTDSKPASVFGGNTSKEICTPSALILSIILIMNVSPL